MVWRIRAGTHRIINFNFRASGNSKHPSNPATHPEPQGKREHQPTNTNVPAKPTRGTTRDSQNSQIQYSKTPVFELRESEMHLTVLYKYFAGCCTIQISDNHGQDPSSARVWVDLISDFRFLDYALNKQGPA